MTPFEEYLSTKRKTRDADQRAALLEHTDQQHQSGFFRHHGWDREHATVVSSKVAECQFILDKIEDTPAGMFTLPELEYVRERPATDKNIVHVSGFYNEGRLAILQDILARSVMRAMSRPF